MKFELLGSVPSKKNSKRRVENRRTGVQFMLPSKNHELWHSDAVKQITVMRIPPIRGQVHVTITFYPPTKVRSDLTNKAESVMDLLVDTWVLEDDNWFVVPEIVLKFGGVDKLKPRAEIEITKL